MTNIAKSIGLGLATSFQGLLLFIGATLISAGAWYIYRPAGLIVAGVMVIAGVIFHAIGDGRGR